jgi:glycine/D-amino acid oxidase-like deaminating enzyme
MVENQKYDVIIVGAGIIGLSTAFHIKNESRNLRVLVVEKAPSYAQGNTGKSAAGFRDMFSSEINFKLSSSTINFYKHVQQDLGYDIGMDFVGYLFLMSDQQIRSGVAEEFAKRTKVRVLERDELSHIPNINLNPDPDAKLLMDLADVDAGLLGLNCGIIEPDLIAKFYFEESKKMGVEFAFSTTVERINLAPVNPLNFPGEPFNWQKKQIASLETAKGTLYADTYILATDVWTTGLLDPVGVDSHIRPKKRQIFSLSGKEVEDTVMHSGINQDGILPFTILPSHGVYIRPAPKERSMWIGLADDIGRDFSFTEDPQPEPDFYNYSMAQVLSAYFPSTARAKVASSWAGYYSYSTTDMNPFIFRELNMVISTGTSGSGILKGDAIGRYTAAVYFDHSNARLYGGPEASTSLLGVDKRNVEREHFIL